MMRSVTKPYLLASGCVLAIVTGHLLNRYWVGDFWAHAAIVRELMRRPLDPLHPLLPVDAPHPLFTPYASLVAAVSTVLSIGPAGTLAAFGLANLVLFLVGLAMVSRALTNRRSELYVLLAVLLLWGRQPWQFSGFLHLSAIGLMAPFPSTFALAITLICAALLCRAPVRPWIYIVIAIASGVVLITHPGAALFLYVGIAALALNALLARRTRAVLQLVGVVPLSLVLAAAWPLYPFLQFTLSEAARFAPFNVAMYQEVWTRAGPALAVGIPVVAIRLWRSPADPLSLWFVGTAAVYTLGWLTQNWGLGRILPFALLLLHIAIGGVIAEIVERHWTAWSPSRRGVVVGLTAAAVAIASVNLASGFIRAVPVALLPRVLATDPRLMRPIDTFGVLDGQVPDEAIVLARPEAGYVVAAQGAKLVALEHHQPFVEGQDERRDAVNAFLSCDMSASDRADLVQRFNVDYVLIDKTLDAPCLASGVLDRLGIAVLETERLRLVKTSSRVVPTR